MPSIRKIVDERTLIADEYGKIVDVKPLVVDNLPGIKIMGEKTDERKQMMTNNVYFA